MINIALLTNTGIAGDGTDQTMQVTEASAQLIIASIGAHNVTIHYKEVEDRGSGHGNGLAKKQVVYDSVTLRGWQTTDDVPLPTQAQIDEAQVAVDTANARLESERQAAITADRNEAIAQVGARMAALFESNIQAAHPPVTAYDVRLEGQWLYATATDTWLSGQIDRIMGRVPNV